MGEIVIGLRLKLNAHELRGGVVDKSATVA
jgi:hypothetical protein